jgi:hypothetical protein
MAAKAMESAIDSAVGHVTEKLKKVQTGEGIKGRGKRRKKSKKPVKKRKPKLPDYF